MKVTIAFLTALILVFPVIALSDQHGEEPKSGTDHGEKPWVVDIEELTKENPHFREVKWTGKFLQMTLMSIAVGGEIGLEKHDNNDQFIRIEQGQARVLMGSSKDDLSFDEEVSDDWAIFIPAGYWHNVKNTGDEELKLYSIYAPAEHKPGEVHATFEEAEAAHHHHH